MSDVPVLFLSRRPQAKDPRLFLAEASDPYMIRFFFINLIIFCRHYVEGHDSVDMHQIHWEFLLMDSCEVAQLKLHGGDCGHSTHLLG